MVAVLSWLQENRIVQAIYWTLLHSLWQGLLVTLIAAALITSTRKAKPATRYNLLTALFILFIVMAGLTFLRQLLAGSQNEVTLARVPLPIPSRGEAGLVPNSSPSATVSTTGFAHTLLNFLNENASWIVAGWYLLFCVKLTTVLFNIHYIRRICRQSTFEPSLYWRQKIARLAQSLGLQHTVILLESSIVKAPMVVGVLKPIILVPLGLLSNLPAEQIEAILLHELAHVLRKDYLVNLLQTLTETIFFFNPGIMWISALIREERENCCDDVTISQTKNKRQLINALVAFQEYLIQQQSPSTGIGFAGQRKHLLNRVKRIVYKENKKLNAMEKGIIILSIIAISFVGFASVNPSIKHSAKPQFDQKAAPQSLDTLPQNNGDPNDTLPGHLEFNSLSSVTNKEGDAQIRTITATDTKGKHYKLMIKNEQPAELYVDDQKIPSGELHNYRNVIADVEKSAELREKKESAKLRVDQREQEKKLVELNAERSELLEKLSEIDEKKAALNSENVKQLRDERDSQDELYEDRLKELQSNQEFDLRNRDALQSLREKRRLDDQQATTDRLLHYKLYHDQADQFNRQNFDDLLLKNKLAREKYQDELLSEGQEFPENYLREKTSMQSLVDPIIQDMMMQNVIPEGQNDLSFELTGKTFTVNGKKQPAEVHERFKAKYLKKDGDYFKFSKKDGHTSISINTN